MSWEDAMLILLGVLLLSSGVFTLLYLSRSRVDYFYDREGLVLVGEDDGCERVAPDVMSRLHRKDCQ
jgi:hypothetical protein